MADAIGFCEFIATMATAFAAALLIADFDFYATLDRVCARQAQA